MTMLGRAQPLPELSGDGVDTYKSRLLRTDVRSPRRGHDGK